VLRQGNSSHDNKCFTKLTTDHLNRPICQIKARRTCTEDLCNLACAWQATCLPLYSCHSPQDKLPAETHQHPVALHNNRGRTDKTSLLSRTPDDCGSSEDSKWKNAKTLSPHWCTNMSAHRPHVCHTTPRKDDRICARNATSHAGSPQPDRLVPATRAS
jgi:hypothetical protein